ncbi:MAG: hypothetical protein ACFKPT_03045 [Gloeotrichia echinulata GP01]
MGIGDWGLGIGRNRAGVSRLTHHRIKQQPVGAQHCCAQGLLWWIRLQPVK